MFQRFVLSALLAALLVAPLPAQVTIRDNPRFTDIGPSASSTGQDWESNVGNDPRTRRQVVKQILRDLFTGYVTKDISRVRKQFSPDLIQDLQIIINAITEDYQTQSEFNVDVQIMEFRRTLGTYTVRFIWNRNAIDQRTGQTLIHSGECTFQMDRHHGFTVRQMGGPVPFGIFNPLLRKQLELGQTNYPLVTILGPPPPPGGGGGPPPPPPPPPATAGNINLAGMGTFANNCVAIDFEAGTQALFTDTSANAATPPTRIPLANEDIYMWIDFSGFEQPYRVQRVNGATSAGCPSSGAAVNINQMRDINPVGLGTAIHSVTAATFPFIGVQTAQGNYVIMKFNGPVPPTQAVNPTLLNTVVLVNPPGTEPVCP